MRARTRRLKSLLVGIVSVLWSGHGHTPPSSVAPRRPKGLRDADPGVCPPLPHGDPRWGRIDEVGRGSPPGIHHAASGRGWQDPRPPAAGAVALADREWPRDIDAPWPQTPFPGSAGGAGALVRLPSRRAGASLWCQWPARLGAGAGWAVTCTSSVRGGATPRPVLR